MLYILIIKFYQCILLFNPDEILLADKGLSNTPTNFMHGINNTIQYNTIENEATQ